MHDPTIAADASADAAVSGRPSPLLAKTIARLIGPIHLGTLTIDTPSGARLSFRGQEPGAQAHVRLTRWRALRRFVVGGDTALAAAYRDGDWSSDDLGTLLRWAIDNYDVPGGLGNGLAPLRWLARVRHLLHSNTRRNSRRNIRTHYDLGNDFYAAWLDKGMTYSSGLYTAETLSLEDAQDAKLSRIVDLLQSRPGDRVLEIGCGWGSLAERLIATRGCSVTGLTLSPSQLEYATARLDAAGLGHHADLRLQDYRDVSGRFDGIVSIEMLEAVGEAYWPIYFAKLAECLAPHGRAVLQVITIRADRYDAYRASPDFIQRHIFPGGMLPTTDVLADQARQVGLRVVHQQSFAPSYAATLAAWRDRFARNADALELLGFDAAFRRLWSYYLTYCEAGFAKGWLDVHLIVLAPTADT